MFSQTILNIFRKMRKLFSIISVLAIIALLASCSMKECECYSTNVFTQDDVIVQAATDTVKNFTRGECEEFNKDEVLVMDSTVVVHHTIFCTEK